jgi:hypothetical protein
MAARAFASCFGLRKARTISKKTLAINPFSGETAFADDEGWNKCNSI